ncbi:MAG TPA: acetyl/propionyl/methylcrotonyl-CoA carboxylase subunit alpha [Burkholderiales bacterium]|nr:acetyl/propionyl/methylcrotonyl-CoA carboxylase subunit alpha [Burkholderiales bacterium]
MFAKVLIANRGEIACRVIRTARRLGVRTVAVYADPDRDALHVRQADEALRIESYLDIASILAAAKKSGAQAIHPGYGFLSENEDFAAACAKTGVVFIGPSEQAIAAMGDKAAAKRLMEKAGVPLVPGYHGEDQDPAFLAKEAARIGFPVLIKPSAGGGGKGMRVVTSASSFKDQLEGAKREAKSSFGDDRVLIERYLERPRHIEVQVFGDNHGNVVHLFERDCSVQRRHQKVLEEAPAPGMTPSRRNEMGQAAVAAAKAIKYSGAGTVEFIAEPDGRFYFMEMNTRLQVEHPVTEMITGLDLVEWQLKVASGEALPLQQQELSFTGHAIEARIYAEDPDRDFLPATGKLVHLAWPAASPEVRIDTGVEAGAEITPWYDPMIAKLVVRGPDRGAALATLRRALSEVEIAGVTSNVTFLSRVAASRAFAAAELDTGLIERNRAELLPPPSAAPLEALVAAAFAELRAEERAAAESARASGDPHSPWQRVDGWRLNGESHHDFAFLDGESRHPVRISFTAEGERIDGQVLEGRADGERYFLRLGERSFSARAIPAGRTWHVFCNGGYRRLALEEDLRVPGEEDAGGSLAAPMPGKVIKLLVEAGAKVKKGDSLLILEAMKMEHTITAPADGTVKEIHFTAGEQVLEGAQLITLE